MGLIATGYTFIGVAMALLSVPLLGLVMAVIFIVQVVILVASARLFFKRSHAMLRLFKYLGWGVFAPIMVFGVINLLWAMQHYG